MGVPWEGGTDNTKEPEDSGPRRYNADGTINKKWVPPGVRRRAKEAAEQDMDSGMRVAERTIINRRIKKQNEDRIENRQKRVDQAITTKNKRAREAAVNEKTAAKVGFAPYQDRVRTEKDKQRKKMKEMQKRSYYEDL